MSVTNVPRKDKTLNEAIEILNEPFLKANGNYSDAWKILRQYPDQMEFVTNELDKCLDLRYFLEEYYCIKTENGLIKTMYPFWQHQEIIYEAVQEEWNEKGQCLLIILKPRQCGATVWVSASMFHRVLFTPNTFLLTVAQNDRTSAHIFKLMSNAYFYLPWWMQPEQLFKQEGQYIEFQRQDDARRLTDPGLGSVIQIDHAQKMTGVAIGRTVRAAHFSEVSRWPDADVFTADIEPSMNARDEYAVMESTAFGRNGLFYDHWRGSVDGDTGWRALFIPVYKVRKYSLPLPKDFQLTKEERVFTERIKKEDNFEISPNFWEWRRRRLKATIRSTGSPWGHMESYPITPDEAFQSSGVCAFDRMSLQNQRLGNVFKPNWVGEIALVNVEQGIVNTDMIREVRDDEILPKRKSDNNQLKRDRLYVWEWPEPHETYYVGCLPDGELVRTKRGQVPIEQVADDDLLLDDAGDFVPITAKMRYRHDGEVVSIKTYGSSRPYRFTPNHPILVRDKNGEMKWREAGRVKVGDWVRYPKPRKTVLRGEELLAKWPQDIVRIDFRIPSTCLWDTEFWWMVGLWLADGDASEKNKMGRIHFYLNAKDEQPLADRLKKYVRMMSGRECWQDVSNNCIRIHFHSVQMARFLHDNFGNSCRNKHVEDWVKHLPMEHLTSLIEGYFHGDGCLSKPQGGHKFATMNFVSVSENLVCDVQDILLSMNIFGAAGVLREAGKTRFKPDGKEFKTVKTFDLRLSAHYTCKLTRMWGKPQPGDVYPEFKRRDQRTFTMWDGEHLYSKVHKVSKDKFSGYVNNFETQTHTYCVGLMTTHNSDTALGVPDGDYSVAEVWKLGMGAKPDTQVAEWWGHCPPSDFAKINAALGFWYRGQNSASEIATEYQGPGITCGDKLKDMDYPNLYRPMHKDRVQNPYTNWFHWMTNQKTRDSIIATMNEALLAHTVCIRSEDLIDEMVDFGSLGGRFEGQGNHDDAVMSSMIGLYCMRETTLHIKQAGVAEESMHRQTADLNVYAVYDNLMRQRGQYASEVQAKTVAGEKQGWTVKPMMVCKANTAWSPIFHGSGAARDLHQKYGMRSVDILPDVVSSYQSVLDSGRGDMDDDEGW